MLSDSVQYKIASEMTYIVSGGELNSTQSVMIDIDSDTLVKTWYV